MTSIAVIQARTNSARLPGKVLLNLAGMPIVVLAALRAGNTGRKVLVATSSEQTDDLLADVLASHGVACFRGALDDVLSRFVGALSDYDDDTIVFRLTADNVVPDGRLLDEIERDFLARQLPYMCCNGAPSGLPYGVSAEVTRLRYLRIAHERAVAPADREHVTPWIVRHYGLTYFEKYLDRGMGGYRCTIDCLDDYLAAARLFERTGDPVHAPTIDLIEGLVDAPHQPQLRKPADKLVLGTAQLGMRYGIANAAGRPDREGSRQLIRTAIVNGVRAIDTARAYGDSEEMIGYALGGGWQDRVEVITKLSPLAECPADAAAPVVHAFADASFFRSVSALGGQKVSTLLLHRASQMGAWNGSLRDRLLSYRDGGKVEKIGVSVQTGDELAAALADEEVGHVQLPYNLLDARWESRVSDLQAARAERGLTVHVRSVFLQGLLGSRTPEHWLRANVADPNPVWNWLDGMCEQLKRKSAVDLCIAFAAAQPWIDGIVIGMETMEQLMENLSLFERLPLSPIELETVRATRPHFGDATLNPALWIGV